MSSSADGVLLYGMWISDDSPIIDKFTCDVGDYEHGTAPVILKYTVDESEYADYYLCIDGKFIDTCVYNYIDLPPEFLKIDSTIEQECIDWCKEHLDIEFKPKWILTSQYI